MGEACGGTGNRRVEGNLEETALSQRGGSHTLRWGWGGGVRPRAGTSCRSVCSLCLHPAH